MSPGHELATSEVLKNRCDVVVTADSGLQTPNELPISELTVGASDGRRQPRPGPRSELQ